MGREKDLYKQLLQLLPAGWEAKAKELGALQRARAVKTPGELLRLILLYLTEGKSFAGTSAILLLSGKATISKPAVFKRIQKSAQWLKWLCVHIYRAAGLLAEKPLWLEGKNVILVDGSEDVKWGGQQHYYMLHYSLDLFTLCAREFLLTDMKTGEKLSNFKQFGAEDIVIGDRGYGTLPGISYLMEKQAGYVLRIRGAGGFSIYDEEHQKIDLLQRLCGLQALETTDISAYCVINGRHEPVRICVLRKDKESEEAGRQRISKTNQRKRGEKAVSVLQQENNKYIMVITSLGAELSAAEVLELYRARWQIEIAFKRLKSIFRYNEMPARLPENIRTWFYGKLLLAALCETLVNTGRFSPSG